MEMLISAKINIEFMYLKLVKSGMFNFMKVKKKLWYEERESYESQKNV